MMRNVFFIIMFFGCGMCYCQNNISTNQSNLHIRSKISDTSNITINNPRILRYLPYSFYLDIEDTSNILIEGRNVSISRDRRNLYRMNIGDSISNIGQIFIYRIEDGTKTKINETNIRIYETPITIRLAHKKSGSLISFEELQSHRLTASIDNFDIDLEFPIKSFKLNLIINDTLLELKGNGNHLNDEQLKYLKKIKENHPIIFKDITIEKWNGALMKMEPIIYFLQSPSYKN